MECNQVRERLSCYVDGVLDEATLEAIEAHLELCAECRSELEMLQTVVGLTSELSEVEPPRSLSSAIRNAVARDAEAADLCARYLPMLPDYLDDELSVEESAQVALHIAECDRCAGEYAVLQALAGSMDLVADVDPPANLRKRIAAATTRQRTAPLVLIRERVSPLIAGRGLRWSAGFAAAASVAAVWLLQSGKVQQTPPASVTPIQRPVEASRPAEPTVTAQSPNEDPAPPQETVADRPTTHYGARTVSHRNLRNRPRQTDMAKLPPSRKPLIPAVPKEAVTTAEPPVEPEDTTPATTTVAAKPVENVPATPPVEVKAPMIKVASTPDVRREDFDKLFQDVKAAARMMRRDSNRITVDVVSKKF